MSYSYNQRKKAIKRGETSKGKKWERIRALFNELRK